MAFDAETTSLNPETLEVLSTQILGGVPVVDERRLSGGFSSDNLLLRTGRGASFVLRRFWHRNTCAVEAALMRLVADRAPVPEVVYFDDGAELLGAPFILTRFASGVPLTAVLAGAGLEDGTQSAQAVAEVLAAINSVRFGKAGFFSDGALRPIAAPPANHDNLAAFVETRLASGQIDAVFDRSERLALAAHAEASAPLAAAVCHSDQLVHSDFNPKNVLMRPGENGRWRVSAVLDWEYAFSGSALFDIGNMLRFPEELPPGFAESFPKWYEEFGGALPENWRKTSEALDLFALADLLTRSPDHPVFPAAVAAVRRRLALTC